MWLQLKEIDTNTEYLVNSDCVTLIYPTSNKQGTKLELVGDDIPLVVSDKYECIRDALIGKMHVDK